MPDERQRVCAASLASPLSPSVRWHRCMAAALLLWSIQLLLPGPAMAWTGPPLTGMTSGSSSPALGINVSFGRWKDTARLVYDPDGAPEAFADEQHFMALLEEAVSRWQRISGVDISVTGVDAAALDDRTLDRAQKDGLVRVYWGDADGALGVAGPTFDFYDFDLGYFPYGDGTLELNENGDVWRSDLDLVGTLVHEIGHLLGLGHSDHPQSVMYANPYNHLVHPYEDDIRAMQVLYGPPLRPFDPALPLPEWRFEPPPEADSAATRYLFSGNQAVSRSAHFSVDGSRVAAVDDETPDNEFLWLESGGIGDFANRTTIDLQTTVVLVDPFGYAVARAPWSLYCKARVACGGAAIGFARTESLKTLPGVWRVYVLDEQSDPQAPVTLLALEFPVLAAVERNRPPLATLAVAAGNGPAEAVFTLQVTDPEGGDVAVVWRPPGVRDLDGDSFSDAEVTDEIASGATVTRSFWFDLTGTHVFYIEVNDDAPRYTGQASGTSNAGRGFQTLLRVAVTLPVTDASLQVVSTTDTGSGASLYTAAADRLFRDGVLTTTGAATSAGFRLGATADRGLSTGTLFPEGTEVLVAGAVEPQAADVGQAGEIFVVMNLDSATGNSWIYRGADGLFQLWDGRLESLTPAYATASLRSSEAWELFSGDLVRGIYDVYMGYRLLDSPLLHYTGAGLRLQGSSP